MGEEGDRGCGRRKITGRTVQQMEVSQGNNERRFERGWRKAGGLQEVSTHCSRNVQDKNERCLCIHQLHLLRCIKLLIHLPRKAFRRSPWLDCCTSRALVYESCTCEAAYKKRVSETRPSVREALAASVRFATSVTENKGEGGGWEVRG